MVNVELTTTLYLEIEKKFKKEATKIFDLLDSLKENPKKGKLIGSVGGIIIKELKYEGFRFYFITDGFVLRAFKEEELEELLFLFVRMSNKKEQQSTIEEIKTILKTLGPQGL